MHAACLIFMQSEAATCRGEEVVSLWLESGGAEVRWNYSKAPTAMRESAKSFRKLSASAGAGAGEVPARGPAGAFLGTGFGGLGLGRVALVAKSGLMLLLSNSPSGKLQASTGISGRESETRDC